MAGGLTIYEASKFKIELSADGTTWLELVGASAWTPAGGEAESREVDAFGRQARITGAVGIPTLEVDAVAPAVMTEAWALAVQAYKNSTILQFRGTFEEVVVQALKTANADTAAIATTGVVTFAGGGMPDFSSTSFNEGLAIKIGGKDYPVSRISEAGVPSVYPTPGSAVAAAVYAVVIPSIRQGPFTARLGVAGNFTVATGGDLASAMTINPTGQIPDYALVNPPS